MQSPAAGRCERCGAALPLDGAGPAMPSISLDDLGAGMVPLDARGGPATAVGPEPTSPAPAAARYGVDAFAPGAAVDPFAPIAAAPGAPDAPGDRAPVAVDAAEASAFVPPGGEADRAELGVERSTRAIRISNLRARAQTPSQPGAAARASAPPAVTVRAPDGPGARPRRSGVAVAVALVAVVAAAVIALALRGAGASGAARSPGASGASGASVASVAIRVVAPAPIEVTIDGHPAGKTPLTLHRPRSAQPIVIAAPGVARQVVPDRDQLVELAP